ncbi:MAG: hypothetical protein R3D34_06815 [Nitratireductor sp.]
MKSLGEMVADEKGLQEWLKQGAAGGISLGFGDMLPSDALAKGMAFDTIRSKTLFQTSAGWSPESVRLPGFVQGGNASDPAP